MNNMELKERCFLSAEVVPLAMKIIVMKRGARSMICIDWPVGYCSKLYLFITFEIVLDYNKY